MSLTLIFQTFNDIWLAYNNLWKFSVISIILCKFFYISLKFSMYYQLLPTIFLQRLFSNEFSRISMCFRFCFLYTIYLFVFSIFHALSILFPFYISLYRSIISDFQSVCSKVVHAHRSIISLFSKCEFSSYSCSLSLLFSVISVSILHFIYCQSYLNLQQGNNLI